MSDKWHGGKGDKPRPVDKEKFDTEFDRIFGKVAKEFVDGVMVEDKNQDEPYDIKAHTPKHAKEYYKDTNKDTIDFISAKYLNHKQSAKTEDE